MSANLPLQARAGRNSPQQSLAPEFVAIQAINPKLKALAAPGADVKIVDGRDGAVSPYGGLRVFMGANVGAAAITLTATVKDASGMVVQTVGSAVGAGPNTLASFGSIGSLLPEGYSLWLNATLTAGVYGGDAVALFELLETPLKAFGPKDLTTSLQEVVVVEPGHAVQFGTLPSVLYNTDSIAHDVEAYLSNAEGDTLIGTVSVPSVDFGPVPPTLALALGDGDSLKLKLLVPIATAGKKVTAFGVVQESNQFNV